MKKGFLLVCLAGLLACCIAGADAAVIYVNWNSPNSGPGDNWNDAFHSGTGWIECCHLRRLADHHQQHLNGKFMRYILFRVPLTNDLEQHNNGELRRRDILRWLLADNLE